MQKQQCCIYPIDDVMPHQDYQAWKFYQQRQVYFCLRVLST